MPSLSEKLKPAFPKPAARPAACCDHASHKGPGGLVCRCRSMLQLANARRHVMFQHAATPDAVSCSSMQPLVILHVISLLTGNGDFA
jgi:hypothetical protein